MSNDTNPKYPWTPFEIGKLSLRGPRRDPEDYTTASSLSVRMFNNSPGFLLFRNDGTNYKSLALIMNFVTMTEIFNELVNCVDDKEYKSMRWTVKGYKELDGTRTTSPVAVGGVTIGRDSEGVVSITIATRDDKHFKFNFGADYMIVQSNSKGEKLNAVDQSEKTGKAWASLLRSMMNTYVFNGTSKPVKYNEETNKSTNTDTNKSKDDAFDVLF